MRKRKCVLSRQSRRGAPDGQCKRPTRFSTSPYPSLVQTHNPHRCEILRVVHRLRLPHEPDQCTTINIRTGDDGSIHMHTEHHPDFPRIALVTHSKHANVSPNLTWTFSPRIRSRIRSGNPRALTLPPESFRQRRHWSRPFPTALGRARYFSSFRVDWTNTCWISRWIYLISSWRVREQVTLIDEAMGSSERGV